MPHVKVYRRRDDTRVSAHYRRGPVAVVAVAVGLVAMLVWGPGLLKAASPGSDHAGGAGSTSSSRPATPGATAGHMAATSASAGDLTMLQEPAAGYVPVYTAIAGAKRSVDMTMYELADHTAQADLIAAHRRGVTVRIILDAAFHGQQTNLAAYDQLVAAGVPVRWAPSHQIFHQKSLVIDQTVAYIGTGNLTEHDYPTTRDAIVVDHNSAQVKAITSTFNADWESPAHSGNTAGAPGLMWSPGGAEQQVIAFIGAATKTLDFTSEELADTKVVDTLAAAAKRGVTCRIVMTDSTSWAPAFTTTTAAGCAVHVFPDRAGVLYVHEKLIVVDNKTMLLGSQNATITSLDRNRELSIDTAAPALVAAAAATFTTDFNAAARWTPTRR